MTVVISSCDAYADCWKPFWQAFQSQWPDCPYPVLLMGNHLRFEPVGVSIGEDRHWGSNLLRVLEEVEDDYILYMQEDSWLISPVHNAFIAQQLDYCKRKGLDYLRLTFPWMDKYRLDDSHAVCPRNEPYAVCLQSAIWKKETLKSMIADGMTGWDFESMCNNGLGMKVKAEVLLEKVSKKHFHYLDAVRKGRWTRYAVKYLKKNGFHELVGSRPCESAVYAFLTRMITFPLVGRRVYSMLSRIK